MKCPKCGNELEEGKLLCEQCGEEIKIVPDFDIELETQMDETISNIVENISVDEISQQDMETDGHQKTDAEEPEDAGDLKESLRDYYPGHGFNHIGKKTFIVVLSALAIIAVVAAGWILLKNSRDNSFDYQYNRAIECAADNHYDEAIAYLERAIALDSDVTDARFLLAKYYDKNGQQQSAILVLQELINMNVDNIEEIYDYPFIRPDRNMLKWENY